MTTVAEIEAPPGAQEAYSQLRALGLAYEADWVNVVASDLPRGRHTLALPEDRFRTLWRGEPGWYSVGAADAAAGRGDLVESAMSEPVPPLLTLEEAGAMLPALTSRTGTIKADTLGYEAVDDLVQTGALYALYGHKVTKYVFRCQVAALALQRRAQALRIAGDAVQAGQVDVAARQELEVWAVIRRGLPPDRQPWRDTYASLPSPANPVLDAVTEPKRRQRALLTAAGEGWFVFEAVDGGGAVGISGVDRLVPPEGVLPYVLAVGDFHGAGHLVAYREELG